MSRWSRTGWDGVSPVCPLSLLSLWIRAAFRSAEASSTITGVLTGPRPAGGGVKSMTCLLHVCGMLSEVCDPELFMAMQKLLITLYLSLYLNLNRTHLSSEWGSGRNKPGTGHGNPTNVTNQCVFMTLLWGLDWFYYRTSETIIVIQNLRAAHGGVARSRNYH